MKKTQTSSLMILLFFTLVAQNGFTQTARQPTSFWKKNGDQSVKTPGRGTGIEEVGYEELVNEYSTLKRKKQTTQATENTNPSKVVASYTFSFAQYNIRGDNVSLSHQGLGFAYMQEFRPQVEWLLGYKNLPTSRSKGFEVQAHEFDFTVGYLSQFEKTAGFRSGAGIATRYLNESDPTGFSNQEISLQFLIGAGVFYHFSPRFEVGFEPQAKFNFITRAADRNAYDLNLKLGANF